MGVASVVVIVGWNGNLGMGKDECLKFEVSLNWLELA